MTLDGELFEILEDYRAGLLHSREAIKEIKEVMARSAEPMSGDTRYSERVIRYKHD